jgi:Uma2 family endonuclease
MVWAMAGGSPDHAAVAGNILTLLNNALRNRRCRAFTSDLRIRVRATGLGTYPDVSVVCDELELDPEDPKGQTVVNPRVLVEVLSPSTEEYDRGEKLEHYQKIASLAEILLVSHDQRRVELWRRDGPGWVREEFGDRATVPLHSLGCELSVEEIYRNPLA